jgi:ABC-type antimicrobial peptide transport system ATPase subunit
VLIADEAVAALDAGPWWKAQIINLLLIFPENSWD